jgi:hypothetical protein
MSTGRYKKKAFLFDCAYCLAAIRTTHIPEVGLFMWLPTTS